MKERIAIAFLLFGPLFSVDASAFGVAGQQASQQPFFEAREHQTAYAGPGRDDPEPEDLKEVRIGYFGPTDPAHPEAGDIWLAVNLAIDEANAEGGYRGLPFRLVTGWAENPWSNGAGLVARMAYVDRVWAIIGGIDGPSTHLAEQVVAKARLTLISPASTDKSVNLANVPWMFSSLPGDHLLAPIVGSALQYAVGGKAFVIIASNDHDSHMFLRELERHLWGVHCTPAYKYEFESAKVDPAELANLISTAGPVAVVVVAGARDSAAFVNALRKAGFTGKVFGGPAMGRRVFRELLQAKDQPLFFPCPGGPHPQANPFVEAFAERFGFAPDYAARQAYESTRLLVAAIRRAGLNRARIRDAVQELSPWKGTAASIEWDKLGQNLEIGDSHPFLPGTSQRMHKRGVEKR